MTPTQYLKKVYGLEPNDLDLTPGKFDIEEVERLALKYDLDRLDVNAYGMPDKGFISYEKVKTKTRKTKSKPKQKMETIDITPTWQAALQIYLAAYENSETYEGRKNALDGLKQMADVAQAYADHVKNLPEAICYPVKEVDGHIEQVAEGEDFDFYGVYVLETQKNGDRLRRHVADAPDAAQANYTTETLNRVLKGQRFTDED